MGARIICNLDTSHSDCTHIQPHTHVSLWNMKVTLEAGWVERLLYLLSQICFDKSSTILTKGKDNSFFGSCVNANNESV